MPFNHNFVSKLKIVKILNGIILIIIALLYSGCNNFNQPIEKYNQYVESNKNPIFSIDYKSKSESNYVYQTYKFPFLNDSLYSAKFELRLRDKKFIAALNEPKSDEFILFDLNSKLNVVNKIIIKNSKIIRTLDCILEQKITNKQNLEVNIFRIKKWGKHPPFFGGGEIDLIIFVTEKYGVIGSYGTRTESNGQQIRFGVCGDILREYIDYTKIQEVVFE